MEHTGTRQRHPARRVLTAVFVAVYAVALLPVVYIPATRRHELVAAVPLSVWYMLGVSVAAIVATGALYLVERGRGELD